MPHAAPRGSASPALPSLIATLCFALGVPGPFAAPMTFSEQTQAAGINHLHSRAASDSDGEAAWMSGAAAAEDFDNDGFVDLYVQQGGASANLLYMNDGMGGFVDRAAEWNADLQAPGMGVASADFDNDGDHDLVLTIRNGLPLLLENLGGASFAAPVTISFPGTHLSMMGASWGDANNDGLLELGIAQWATQPTNFWLLRLDEGTYKSYEFRAATNPDRRVFSPRFADFDNDRLADLPLVADFSRSELYMNMDGETFRRTTTTSGACTDQNGMGNAIGDFDNDGDLDWFVSSIYDLSGDVEGNWGISGNRLYRNRGDGTFEDVTTFFSVRDGNWGWGSSFGDLDLDGDLDLYHVNGWADPRASVGAKFNNQPARLFENRTDRDFDEVASASGAADSGQGRGLLLFDYDNDGDLDIYICNNQVLTIGPGATVTRDPAPSVLYRNDTVRDGRGWLKARLAGAAPTYHREGIGSRIYVSTGDGVRQMRELHASTNFMSQEPGRIAHFGLGLNPIATEVVAEWSLGDAVLFENVAPNQEIVLPSPTATVDRRMAKTGETVMAFGAHVEPLSAPRSWLIEGATHEEADVSFSFATPGSKTLRLNLYEPDGVTLLRAELLRMSATGPQPITAGIATR